ncbi:MAG: 3-phosphoshikimate 1-carboxyvinyltransferase [Planctomycetes bacterium]|nr:3-phosphoshikimate 1-carboxyvinyltransferase [Planctomycetota bacterium]
MKPKRIRPASKPLDCSVRIPGSKSLTNRALPIAALADGPSTLTGALFSDDTELMMACLQSLGIRIDADIDACTICVHGCGGNIPASRAELFCGNSGTTIRFCTALCTLGQGQYTLDGNDRMRQRPIGDLVDALRVAGAVVGYEGEDGYPPVVVRGGGMRSTSIALHSPPSSQYVSAILMAAPYAKGDMFVEVTGAISAPYLSMTTKTMEAFGASTITSVKGSTLRYVVPAPQRYAGRAFAIEPDASNASYFFAAPAIAGGRVTVENIGTQSVQGDILFVDALEQMGCEVTRSANAITVSAPTDGSRVRGIDIDLNAMPDTAQTLAVVALFADGPTSIRNVANLRVKETDRLTALSNELSKLGAKVEVTQDSITIHPPKTLQPATICTYDDHRMAMSFALAGLKTEGIEIEDPTCVNKTFPDFFDRFEAMYE